MLSEADRLAHRVSELNKLPDTGSTGTPPGSYKDKAEVIAELTKRDIRFDARKSKADLEALLAAPQA